jgi:hypothetical protein
MLFAKEKWMENIIKGLFVLLIFLSLVSVIDFVIATPAGPSIGYVSNSTATTLSANRSQDLKGTITTLNLSSNQQDYKWKAYTGNVTGSLVLDDASGKSIYDWNQGTPTGEVYVSRASSISWANVSCVNQTVIDSEQSALGMTSASVDSINKTFNYTTHKSFLVGTKNITNSSCRSTATYINDARQSITESAYFQEILLKDDITSNLVYTTIIENHQAGYNGVSTFDFQLLVAENESSSTPLLYYFYVELG